VHYSKKTRALHKSFFVEYSRAEKNELQQRYDSTITEINQRLSNKATLQINLNETRDTVRETNQYVGYDNIITEMNFNDLLL
jgi:ElaB/YqjD/DUF883 family membrane-anchored ribosome-binding protein